MSDQSASSQSASLPIRTWTFLVVCAIAGALAVPPHPVAMPLSALVAGGVGGLGLYVWRWSRLIEIMSTSRPPLAPRLLLPLLWLGVGFLVGLVLLGVIRWIVEPAIPVAGSRIAAAGALPLWRRAVIIYVAAVGEEILFRLLLLSLIAGLASRLVRSESRRPSQRIIHVANGLAALAFAAVHLPAWSAIGTLTPAIALIVLALNALGGLVFGLAFVRRGILAAIWVHAGADCAIQIIGPLTG